MNPIPEFQAVVGDIRTVAAETKVFRFRVEASAGKNFDFIPGQFVSLKIAEKVFRAYSISSGVAELPSFETCVKILPGGVGSAYLDNLEIGEKITFRGAFGQFVIKDAEKNKIFIATGTGISPMKSFLEEMKNGNLAGTHELIFGVRTAAYASYLEEFLELDTTHDNFSFTLCLSQPEIDDVPGQKGRVTQWVSDQDASHFAEKDVYICGSPPMVKEVTKILTEEKNFPKENIHTEAY